MKNFSRFHNVHKTKVKLDEPKEEVKLTKEELFIALLDTVIASIELVQINNEKSIELMINKDYDKYVELQAKQDEIVASMPELPSLETLKEFAKEIKLI